MMLKIVAQVLLALGLCVAGTILYGASQWHRRVNDSPGKIEAVRERIAPAIYDARQIKNLPAPVQHFHAQNCGLARRSGLGRVSRAPHSTALPSLQRRFANSKFYG